MAWLDLLVEKVAHNDIIWSIDFSPDGTKIVSCSSDKTLKVLGALAFLNCQL